MATSATPGRSADATAAKHVSGTTDWTVYILSGCSSKSNRLGTYVGMTNNLQKRLAAHNRGKGAKSTKGRSWSVLCSLSPLASKSHALSLEASIKNWSKPKTFRRVCKRLRISIDAAQETVCLPDTHERRLCAIILFEEIRRRYLFYDETFLSYKWVKSFEKFPQLSVQTHGWCTDLWNDEGTSFCSKMKVAHENFRLKWSSYRAIYTCLEQQQENGSDEDFNPPCSPSPKGQFLAQHTPSVVRESKKRGATRSSQRSNAERRRTLKFASARDANSAGFSVEPVVIDLVDDSSDSRSDLRGNATMLSD